MKFLTTEPIGPKRAMTPEGYLCCYDVPIARTGTQLYNSTEIPTIPAGRDGILRIERDEAEVFRSETIASALGKPLVDEHPDTDDPTGEGWDVNPDNWTEVARGVVINPRRGEGPQNDLLLCDILITDASAIQAVLDGKVELSCGYSAEYETIEPGRGRQTTIIINHVALVKEGRCGSRCSIGDENMTKTRDKKRSGTMDKAFAALDAIKRAFKVGDKEAIEEGMKKIEDEMTQMGEPEGGEGAAGGDNHIHVHLGAGEAKDADPVEEPEDPMQAMTSRMDRMEQLLAKFAPALEKLASAEAEEVEEGVEDEDIAEGEVEEDDPDAEATGDRRTKDGARMRARDSTHLADDFKEVVAKAEMLSPGIPVPTFDSRQKAVNTLDSLCKFRRRSLNRAWGTDDGKSVIAPIFGKGDLPAKLKGMTCDAVRTLFNGAAELSRVHNNSEGLGSGSRKSNQDGKQVTLATLNATHRKMWNQPSNG